VCVYNWCVSFFFFNMKMVTNSILLTSNINSYALILSK
jgi:hypothetical protein